MGINRRRSIMRKVYEVKIKLSLKDFVEADSAQEAEQIFMDMFGRGDNMLDYATVTVKETEQEVE